MKNAYLAVDFGAGSGRVMAASIHRDTLTLEEIHRFPNHQVRMGNHIYWDFPALFREMKQGLRMAVHKGYRIRSIGIDTWGVAICWEIPYATATRAPKACPKSFSHGKPPKTHNRKPNWHDTTPKPAYR